MRLLRCAPAAASALFLSLAGASAGQERAGDGSDAWESEVRAEGASAQLARVAAFLEDPRTSLAGVAAGSFAWGTWLAVEATTESGELRLRCSSRTDPEAPCFADLGAALAHLRTRFELEGASVQAEFAVVAVGEPGAREVDLCADGRSSRTTEEGFATEAWLTLRARAASVRLSVRARWRCEWQAAEGGPPALREVVPLEEEVAYAPRPLFHDASASVFGGMGAWRDELLPGLTGWRGRLDARLGFPLTGTGALALGDVDGDGLEDLYLGQPGGLPNRLFLRRPDGSCVERSAEAGVDFLDPARAALLLDLDGDGDRDLAVGAGEQLLFLSNDGQARFWLEAVVPAPAAAALAAADADLDGDLDLYVCSGVSPFDTGSPRPVPWLDARNGAPDLFYENHGGWVFVDATAARGLAGATGFGRAAAWEDYDQDGDPDLCVAGACAPLRLYRNDGSAFVDVARASGLGSASAVAWLDFDGDGRSDLYAGGWGSPAGQRLAASPRFRPDAGASARAELLRRTRGDAFHRNRSGAAFEELARGVSRLGWAAGALACDLDLDGALDLVVPGGLVTGERDEDEESSFWRDVMARAPLEDEPAERAALEPYLAAWTRLDGALRGGASLAGHGRNAALLARRSAAAFADVSAATGLDLADDARGAAALDWDQDGDEDVLLVNRGAPRLRLLLRDAPSAGGPFVVLVLAGTKSNRDGIGARVELTLSTGSGGKGSERRTLVRTVRGGEGPAQSSTRLTIRLGPAGTEVERVLVRWPGGSAEEFPGVVAGGAWRLVEGAGRAEAWARAAAPRASEEGRDAADAATPWRSRPGRVVLARPVPMPQLELVSPDGSALGLFGLQAGGAGTGTKRPVLLDLFSARSPASAEELRALVEHAEELDRSGIAFLALCADPPEEREAAQRFLDELGWPFPWAQASAGTLALLEGLRGALLERDQALEPPASFLVDAAGALRALETGRLSAEALLAERELLALGEGELLEAAAPFPGRWMFPVLPSDADYFEGRLAARGLAAAAREFARGRLDVVRARPADLLHDFGRRAAAEGRLDEAVAFFRRALAADPRHFDSLFDLALVLHRQERTSEARELYRKALALRPEHVDARFNLALAELALGDRAGAERQLAWLKGRAPELAESLERAVELYGGPR